MSSSRAHSQASSGDKLFSSLRPAINLVDSSCSRLVKSGTRNSPGESPAHLSFRSDAELTLDIVFQTEQDAEGGRRQLQAQIWAVSAERV